MTTIDLRDSTETTGPTGSGIEIRNLSTGYGGVAVVRDLDMAVRPGEVVALLGPNGAGKTTTLLTISGLLKPLDGGITIDGVDVDTKYPYKNARLGLAHVAEDRSLFFQLSVEENLKLGLRGRGAAQKEGLEQALEMLPALKGLLDRRAGLLSGGEQQMLAMARALASQPKFLLVDEMSLGLAPIIVERLLPIVRDVASTGTGVLIVEQHVHMALEVVDRAYVMNRGSISMEGSAAELKKNQDLLLASYMGGEEL